MFGHAFRQHFQVMGADLEVAAFGEQFEIGIDQGVHGETFRLRFPSDGSVTAKVLDADRYQRHLLLNVAHRGLGVSQKYLCGHDEFHWFVAALPEKSEATTLLLRLNVWHEVFRNTEAEPMIIARPTRRGPTRRAERAVFEMTYLD